MTVVPPPNAPPRPTPWAVRLRRAPVTFGVIIATVAVYVGGSLVGFEQVLEFGAKDNVSILAGQVCQPGVEEDRGVNMYSLFALGPPVERFFGAPRMLALYLLSGISGVVFSLAFNPYPSVGASGAIFGLLGALAMFLYLHRGLFGAAGGMQLRQLIIVGALNLVYSAANPGIDLWGHIGGLLAGAACAAYFGPRLAPEVILGVPSGLTDERPWPEVAPRVVVAALAVGATAIAAMMVAAGVGG